MDITIFSNIITSFLLTYIVIPPIVRVSMAKHLFDVPDHRKLNKMVVPTLGGVAIFFGLTLSTLLFTDTNKTQGLQYLYAAIIMMFFIGMKDDIMIISAKKKLIVQTIAALILVILGNYRITNIYGFAMIHELNMWISIPFSVLIILFLVNAINLIDGIDGLAAGISFFISAALGYWFYMTGYTNFGIACFALAGSLVAFLRFNLWGKHYKVFMGDTGSLILGIFLSSMVIKFIELNTTTNTPYHIDNAPIIALGLLIVPITDTLRVFTIRIWNNRSPFSPDMNHLHHLLLKARLNHIQASSFLVAYTIVFSLLALTLNHYFEITTGFILLLSLSFGLVALIHRRSKKAVVTKKEEIQKVSAIKTITLNPRQGSLSYEQKKKEVFEQKNKKSQVKEIRDVIY